MASSDLPGSSARKPARARRNCQGMAASAATKASTVPWPAAGLLLAVLLVAGQMPGCQAQGACIQVAIQELSEMQFSLQGLLSILSVTCNVDTASGAMACCHDLLKTEACVNEICLYAMEAPALLEDTADIAAVVWYACGCRITSAPEDPVEEEPEEEEPGEEEPEEEEPEQEEPEQEEPEPEETVQSSSPPPPDSQD